MCLVCVIIAYMKYVAEVVDEIERNFACVQAGEEQLESRLHHIGQMTLAGKIYETAIVEFVQAFPYTTAKMIGVDLDEMTGNGFRFEGAGTLHTAVVNVNDPHDILKAHRRSVRMNGSDRLSTAIGFNMQHKLLRDYLGPMVLPQVSYVGKHPIKPGETAVITAQEFCPKLYDPKLFHPYKEEVDAEKLEILKAGYPGIEDQLHDLAVQGLRLWEDTGEFLPDTSAPRNIVIGLEPSPRLLCLDGLPVEVDQKSVIERMLGQLTMLRDKTS